MMKFLRFLEYFAVWIITLHLMAATDWEVTTKMGWFCAAMTLYKVLRP